MTTEPMTAYGVVHYLLQKQRGRASAHQCVDCGRPARQWAYDHKDVFERIDEYAHPPMVFSVNFEHYQPMCLACHKALDNEHAGRPAGRARHGTLSMYTGRGCRCELCTRANRDYQRDYRARRSA